MDAAASSTLPISTTPVRRVISRSSAISNGTFRTYKHPAHPVTFVPGDSDNELAFLRFAEMDPAVTSILAQPTVLHATHDGKAVSHVPDFAIEVGGQRALVEVKGARAFAHLDLRRRLDTFAHEAHRAGWDYLVVVGGELLDHPLERAVDSLWRSHRRVYEDLQLIAVTNLLGRGPTTIGLAADALRTAMGTAAPGVREILSMAAGNRILADLEPGTPVGRETVARRRDPSTPSATFIPFRHPPFAPETVR